MAYLIGENVDDDVLHASTYGYMSRSDISFFKERVSEGLRHASGMAAKYIAKARDRLESFDFDELRDKVDHARDRWRRRWDEDRVRLLETIPDLQLAKSVMRSWMMIHPRARSLYRNEIIAGYNGDFFDPDPDADDEDHPMYRQVMQGMYSGNDDEDRYTTFVDVLDLKDEDDQLSDEQRFTIQLSHQRMCQAFDEGGQDPTSPGKHLL